METTDLVGLLIPILYFTMPAIETLWLACAFPSRRGWCGLGTGFLLLVATATSPPRSASSTSTSRCTDMPAAAHGLGCDPLE
jgi:hypothetical protein